MNLSESQFDPMPRPCSGEYVGPRQDKKCHELAGPPDRTTCSVERPEPKVIIATHIDNRVHMVDNSEGYRSITVYRT